MARPSFADSENKPKAISAASFRRARRVLKFFRPYRWTYFIGFIFLVLTSLTVLCFPLILGSLIDNPEFKSLLLLFGIFFVQGIFSFFRVVLFVYVTENSLAALRQAAYARLVRLHMDFFSQRRIGELTSRISSDVSMLQEMFTTTLAEFLRQLIMIVGGIALLAIISIKLMLVMLAIVPVVMIVAVFFGRFIRKFSRKTQDMVAASNTIVEETMQGIATVKAFANEVFETQRHKVSTLAIVKQAIKGGVARGAFIAFITLCMFGAIVTVLWKGAVMVHNNEGLSYGDMTKFLMYSMFVGISFAGVAELYSSMQKAIGATERLMDILEEPIEDISLDNADKVPAGFKISGDVAFENVNF
ncbi:MAG TPA: ABC transporter transmembrane domain-containing protein, partial [Bacteroidia bacterium]|nr:ABC transporter transmembrane domain-containing protein [Bacteroidia bacterium]